MPTVNAHKILHEAPTNADFLQKISIKKSVERRLKDARDEIRTHVRQGIKEWDDRIEKHELFGSHILNQLDPPTLQPRFRTQGSFAYHTVNDPAFKPPQEVDFDDGLFLPVAFFEKNGVQSPIVASRAFFALVESILLPLCQKNGWKLNRNKPSCVRVKLFAGAHYDLPLYAVADKTFSTILENRAQKILNESGRQTLKDSITLDEDVYRGLNSSDIMLAHREDGWIESDPRKLDDWFAGAVRSHGAQIRRVCRYLKAWRDHNWPNAESCKLSSITLMQCVVMAFDDLKSKISQSRDDLALYHAAKRLPEYLMGDVANPVLKGSVLNDNWDQAQRSDYVSRARSLKHAITNALEAHDDPSAIISEFRSVLGPRVPSDVSLVLFETSAAVVRSYEPARVPQPNVTRSTSG